MDINYRLPSVGSPRNGLLELVYPLAKEAIHKLEKELQGRNSHIHVSNVLFDLASSLREELFQLISKAAVLELNLARVSGDLKGKTSEERFYFFCEQLKDPDVQQSFWDEYPVLLKQVETTLTFWLRASCELVQRLTDDWDEIQSTFSQHQFMGKLERIKLGAGDLHNDGRTVAILTFTSGLRLVYKPRSLSVDNAFQQFLSWVSKRSSIFFQPMNMLDKRTYGWCVFIDQKGCESKEEVQRFYQRLGGLLALLYALEATDMHSENLIASGEHPVLIDLESLFQPRIQCKKTPLEYSVIRTNLLPYRVWGKKLGEGIDLSGLSGEEGQWVPDRLPTWIDEGKDTMYLAYKAARLIGDKNRPVLHGNPVSVVDYIDDFINGFNIIYDVLLKKREELLSDSGPLSPFAHVPIRVVLRSTRIYDLLLRERNHPELLQEESELMRFFEEKLFIAMKHQPWLKRTLPFEIESLRNGDIPYFFSYPDSRHLFTHDGTCIPDLFPSTAWENVKERILLLSTEDRKKQNWIIRASISTLTPKEKVFENLQIHVDKEIHWTSKRFLEEAAKIGDHLERTAFGDSNSANWLGLHGSGANWRLDVCHYDLYDGLAGIALFLGCLYKVSGEPKYASLARRACNQIYRLFQKEEESLSIGAFNGWSGVIYSFTHLSFLLNDHQLMEWAYQIVDRLEDPEKEEELDWIGGAAGCLMVLLGLYDRTGNKKAKDLAIRCGNHLIQEAFPCGTGLGWKSISDSPLTGMAHGASGFAFALAKLFQITGDIRYRETAIGALQFERSQFCGDTQNWFDRRGDVPDPTIVQWCTGAPGIGLARIPLITMLNDPHLNNEMEIALKTTIQKGFGKNHSLCHGDGGNIDFVLQATPFLKTKKHLEIGISHLSTSVEQHGWLCGTPDHLETPGLMVGLSGIGMSLLRLISSEIPSVLLLEM